MTVTYDVGTDLGKLRLTIGDTGQTETAVFSDAELHTWITLAGTWQGAVPYALDGLIAHYARQVDQTAGPRKEALSDIVEHYQQLRANLTGDDTSAPGVSVASAIQEQDLAFGWTEAL